MPFDHWIALLGLIVSALSLAVAITAGILAILGYRKIIKSTDDNAKERKAEIEQNADIAHRMLQKMSGAVLYGAKRDKYTVMVLMLLVGLFFWWISSIVLRLEKKIKND